MRFGIRPVAAGFLISSPIHFIIISAYWILQVRLSVRLSRACVVSWTCQHTNVPVCRLAAGGRRCVTVLCSNRLAVLACVYVVREGRCHLDHCRLTYLLLLGLLLLCMVEYIFLNEVHKARHKWLGDKDFTQRSNSSNTLNVSFIMFRNKQLNLLEFHSWKNWLNWKSSYLNGFCLLTVKIFAEMWILCDFRY